MVIKCPPIKIHPQAIYPRQAVSPNPNLVSRSDKSIKQVDIQSHGFYIQVPPDVVRGIVITVLQSQGVTEPSEEILEKAIQEYYAKNPQGVSLIYLGSDV